MPLLGPLDSATRAKQRAFVAQGRRQGSRSKAVPPAAQPGPFTTPARRAAAAAAPTCRRIAQPCHAFLMWCHTRSSSGTHCGDIPGLQAVLARKGFKPTGSRSGPGARPCSCLRAMHSPGKPLRPLIAEPPLASLDSRIQAAPSAPGTSHSPVNLGCRFSAKAASPSWRSLVGMTCGEAEVRARWATWQQGKLRGKGKAKGLRSAPAGVGWLAHGCGDAGKVGMSMATGQCCEHGRLFPHGRTAHVYLVAMSTARPCS